MKRKPFIILVTLILSIGLLQCNPDAPPTEVLSSPEQQPSNTPTLPPDEPGKDQAGSTETVPVEALAPFEKGACPFEVPAGQDVNCGFVTVSADHAYPAGATLRLAVSVFENKSPDAHPDPVVLLCGGPGEKCLADAPAYVEVLAPIIIGRDFVIFDQRGAGLSEPALECPEVSQASLDLLDELDAEINLRTSFAALMSCRDRLVEEGHNLTIYNTAQNAADVNAIRLALGYEQVNLYGGSYGSLLAQAVMRDFPEGIRSVILESVLPLEKSFIVDTISTVPQAILRLFEACAADLSCNTAFPNLEAVLYEVIDRLDAQPVPINVTNPRNGQSYPAFLTGKAVLGNLRAALYQTALIPFLPQAIYDVYHGEYALMTQLTSAKLLFYDVVSIGMQYSVLCNADLVGRSSQEALNAMAEFPRQLTGNLDQKLWMEYSSFAACENWPVESADLSVKQPLVSSIPTLLLSGEFDPVTPADFGRLVARNLSMSRLYVLPGTGHTGESTHPCALSLTAAFLDDPMEEHDSSCIAEMPDLVFSIPSQPTDIVLEPFTDQSRGFRGMVPAGWQELGPANLARGSSMLDPAYFVLEAASIGAAELLADVTGQLGVDPGLQPTRSAKEGSFTWDFYSFELQGNPCDLAVTEAEGKAYFVLLISPAEEHEALYEQLFQPAVTAIAPLE